MKGKLFWGGLTAISLLLTFTLPLFTGTVVFLVAGVVWWWFVYRSGKI